MAFMLVNESTAGTVASRVELALDRSSRRRGLLGRLWMPPTSAIVLSPCWMVHTAFMQFRIDVLFVDEHGRVVQVVRELRPWRIAMSSRARVVIELAAGVAAQRDINIGDRVTLLETSGAAEQLRGGLASLPLEVRAC
jgi:uncharacterized membrane protein (UPF0127 family)